MDSNTLLEMIYLYTDNNADETIEMANDLLALMIDNPKEFSYEFATEIENFSDYCGLCPLCGSILHTDDTNFVCSNKDCTYTDIKGE